MARFQNRENRTSGPKAPPKPAHAKDTIPKTELSGSLAMNTPMMAITTTVNLAMSISRCLLSFRPKIAWAISWDTLEDAAKSCESAVDMVHAKMPASTTPPKMVATMPFWLKSIANLMTIFSESAEDKISIFPVAETA